MGPNPTDWIDDALRWAEDAGRGVGALFEPTLRLGVAGLSRSGKTVFITALVAHLLQRGRLTMLGAEADGRIEAAMLRPQPDPAVPRFAYEDHIAAMTGPDPVWPESTRSISELRISLRFRRSGFFSGVAHSMTGPGLLHLDIVDYPGEWLLDLPLLRQSYDDWARGALAAARSDARAGVSASFLDWVARAEPDAPADESVAREGAERFAAYLRAAREAGLSAVAPGRFLMPGDLEGSPALTFAPLEGARGRSDTLGRLMRDRFEAYKRVVVRPFFKEHFARLDRQIVLVDALSAIDSGPQAVADLRDAMADVLACFRHGENSWLSALLGGRIERLAFAATKADHIHHTQHDRLEAILRALVAQSVARAAYNGAQIASFALASVRATVEQTVERGGETLHCVRGRDLQSGEELVAWPGELPQEPSEIVEAARRGGEGAGWLAEDYGVMRFRPPLGAERAGCGPPHLRLDRVLEFLIGDRLA